MMMFKKFQNFLKLILKKWLLYALITALSNKEGYCFASNKYLGKKLGVDPKTITSWLADLRKYNYIMVDIIRNENKEIIQRKIYPHDVSYPLNNVYPSPSKSVDYKSDFVTIKRWVIARVEEMEQRKKKQSNKKKMINKKLRK